MFKKIQILLTEPICDCETQDICWNIIDGPGLGLTCNQCQTSINIPQKKFYASIILDKKYPKYKCNNCGELHETGLTHDEATIKKVIT